MRTVGMTFKIDTKNRLEQGGDMSDLIEATSRTVKTMADGTLRLTVDISPIHAQQAFLLFGMPDAPVVLARLTQEAAKQSAQVTMIESEKPKGGFLSQWLALRCKQTDFWRFLESAYEIAEIKDHLDCDTKVKAILEITSKADVDNDQDAEARFHSEIRMPYSQWLAGARFNTQRAA